MGIAASDDVTDSSPRYERIIEEIAKEKGISKEEAKVIFEAKLSKIAEKKGITVEKLKKQIAEGKFRKSCRKPMDEAKLKEIAKKRGITVEELKKKLTEYDNSKKGS